MTLSIGLMRSSLLSTATAMARQSGGCCFMMMQQQQQQIRHQHWTVFLEKAKNPQSGKLEYANDSKKWFLGSDLRFDPSAGYLLEYEKPWMKKKRLNDQRIYRKREYKVKELIRYIKVKEELKK